MRGRLADVHDGQAVQVHAPDLVSERAGGGRVITAGHEPPPRRVRRPGRVVRSASGRGAGASPPVEPEGGRPRGASAGRGGAVSISGGDDGGWVSGHGVDPPWEESRAWHQWARSRKAQGQTVTDSVIPASTTGVQSTDGCWVCL